MKSLAEGLTPTIKLRCPTDLYEAFRHKVELEGSTVSEVIRSLMNEYLKTP